MQKVLVKVAGLLAVFVAGLFAVGVASGGQDKVTICHAAGQEGTTKFVTLTIPYNAAFGQAGHFGENGTPNAGHEQDYLGACQTETTPTETTPTETTPTETTPTETTPTETTPTETTPTTPEQPPFKCPNGEEPIHGQDGNAGNDSCDPCAPPVNAEKCPQPPTSIDPPVTIPPTETVPPTGSKPDVPPTGSKPEPPKVSSTGGKVVKVKPGKKPGTVIIVTADGKSHVGVQGSG